LPVQTENPKDIRKKEDPSRWRLGSLFVMDKFEADAF
jgi:hypothetical protein